MEQANNVAKIRWDDKLLRWELRILNQLKAYSEGSTVEEHTAGKNELIGMANEKGYTVIEE